MPFEVDDIIDDGIALLYRLRLFNARIDADTVDSDIDKMREDLGGNLFLEHDKVDVAIHDLLWNLGAAQGVENLEYLVRAVIAKVTVYLLLHTGVDAQRLADYSAYKLTEKS